MAGRKTHATGNRKPMTAAVRERLRVIREKQKGRSTLAGFNSGGWAATVDTLMEWVANPADGHEDFRRAREAVKGFLSGPDAPMKDPRQLNPYGLGVRVNGVRDLGDKKDPTFVGWVRLCRGTAEQAGDLARFLPHRRLRVWSFGGPGRPKNAADVPVFRPEPLLTLLFVMFGEFTAGGEDGKLPAPLYEAFRQACRKYLQGYTDRFTAAWPAPGQRLRVTDRNGGAGTGRPVGVYMDGSTVCSGDELIVAEPGPNVAGRVPVADPVTGAVRWLVWEVDYQWVVVD